MYPFTNAAHVSPYAEWDLPTIEAYYKQYPGAAPGGTGETGLNSNDSQGYADLMNLRTRYQELKSGKPVSVQMLKTAADSYDPTAADRFQVRNRGSANVDPSLRALKLL